MNEPIRSQTEIILQNAQPSIRDALSRYLAGCGFTDPADPVLNALVVQAMLAGQPVRLVEQGGSAIATEAGLARLGDRLDNTAWGLGRMKTLNVLIACLLCIILGAVGMFFVSRMQEVGKGHDDSATAHPDSRIAMLESFGAKLQVGRGQNGTVYVYFKGGPQPQHGNAEGVDYLFFKP